MAFNLSAGLKDKLSSTANRLTSSALGSVGQQLSTSKVTSALSGAIDDKLNGALNGALGDAFGGLSNNLISGAQNKLQGLISNAEELTGLASNPLKVVERGAADLVGLTGDLGVTQETYRDLKDRSAFGDFVDSGYKPPYKNAGTAASRIPNPLRNHSSFNYKITLGVLDAGEYNNPEVYRAAGGFKNYVIQSGGGNLEKRYQVFDEKAGQGGHAEYYIEDLEFDAVVAPNPNTRVTVGTSMSFTVIEPYSMGNFIQAITGSAATAGFRNYLDAPFCLRIDFVGWNEGGGSKDANFIQQPIFIPIQLINMEFNVTGQGSTYAVSAVPMSESGLSDTINVINTPIKTNGVLLHEVMETNVDSVTSAINDQLSALEEVGALAPYDRYIIAFPKTRTSLVDALKARNIDEGAFTTTPEEQEAQRVAASTNNSQLNQTFNNNTITISQTTQTYAVLKSFAENADLMNEIGLSAITTDSNAGGNVSEASQAAARNPETNIVDTASVAAQVPDKAREYQFNQGEKITDIIERMVIQTEYAAEKATEGATNGVNKWFKIDTQVFIDDSPITEAQLGRKPKVYVYSVLPYEVDEAVTLAPGKKPQNTEGLKQAAAKEYNYIYTGKNEDVLNFDINFNNAFMQTALANFGMNTGSQASLDSGKTGSAQNVDSGATSTPADDAVSNDDPSGKIEFANAVAQSSGTHSKDIRRQIAEMFHDRITNLPVDMVTAEMEIIGDPYFIPQETGNYVAQRGDKPNTTADGTMTYNESQVFVVVNFKTPFDYQVQGATMEMPQVVPGFSGLFTVWAVTNSFSGGQFKQTLKMIRRTGQDDPATTGNNNAVQVNNDSAIANSTTQSDGTVGQSGQNSTDCMPAPQADDIRNLMPAVPDDVAASLAEPARQAEEQLAGALPKFSNPVEGVDIGVASVPDLTKVIPKVSGQDLVGSFGNLPDISGNIPNVSDLTAQANDAFNNASSALNKQATQQISAVTDSAKAKVRNLLG